MPEQYTAHQVLESILGEPVSEGLAAYAAAYQKIEQLDPRHQPQIHALSNEEAQATCSCGWQSHIYEGIPLATDAVIFHLGEVLPLSNA